MNVDSCTEPCPEGKYGTNCDQTCSCLEAESSCDPISGKCYVKISNDTYNTTSAEEPTEAADFDNNSTFVVDVTRMKVADEETTTRGIHIIIMPRQSANVYFITETAYIFYDDCDTQQIVKFLYIFIISKKYYNNISYFILLCL